VYATYRIDPGVMRWIRYRGWRLVEQVDEGERIRVRLRFDSEEEVVQFALAYGGDAELIEPADLREVVRDAARRTVEKHSPPNSGVTRP
jgi:predicted DNA-binding transcriptional regulator YafY